MLLTVTVNYLCGRIIGSTEKQSFRTAAMVTGVALSLSFLFFFKYFGFFADLFTGLFGLENTFQKPQLPIGLSFYTFQVITYTVDVYRRKVPVQKSYAKLLLYVSFFPQLIAGPIVNYTDISASLDKRTVKPVHVFQGMLRFLIGLAKKVLLANTCGVVTDKLLAFGELSVAGSWLMILAYAFQIYFDFSGYSDMAIGIGRMFGFRFSENFNYPYISSSITEFWRRWHISLSRFFRDYVYIPLGSNRVSLQKNVRNIMVVWMLTGFWHGASWNFIVWGLYYGLLLLAEKFLLKDFRSKLPEAVNWLTTFLLDRFPGRSTVISLINRLQSSLSFASHEEYLLVAEGPKDLLDTGIDPDDVDQLLEDLQKETTAPTEESTAPTSGDPTETTAPAETTPEKPVTIDDFPSTLYVYMNTGKGEKVIADYSRTRVAAVTAVLNKYAQLLPEDGSLTFTVVPQSQYANQFVNAKEKISFYSTWDDVVNGLGEENVYAFDTAEILSEAIKNDEYVYFRTDMHWTPYGSYLVYSQMVQQAGKIPCSYTEDFDITVEDPFRGTYYRDNPSAYMGVKADTLELLMPKFPLEWRRTTGKDEYKLIDFLNFDAKKNDRYTVYLGGPAGPWTYAESDNGETENCLVITDSFGLGYIPFLTCNYKQVHYYDPRYYEYKNVGYSVSEMIENYDIQDIYVIVGDLHSFESSFILTNANEQLD